MRKFNKTVENYFSKLTIKTIKEGIEVGALENSLTESEYDWLENKIKTYMQKHYNYNVVKEITRHIPTIATVVAAVLRVSTKATIITAVASTLVELIIRLVIRFFVLPDTRIEEDEDDDLFEDEFEDDDLFEEMYIPDEKPSEDVATDEPLSESVEEAVDTVVEQALNPVTEAEDSVKEVEEKQDEDIPVDEVLNDGIKDE